VAVASTGWAGGAVLLDLDARACIALILTPVGPPPALSVGLPTQHTMLPPHCARQAPTPRMVCRGGGGALAVAGEGAVKGCKHTRVSGNVPCMHHRRGLTALSQRAPGGACRRV